MWKCFLRILTVAAIAIGLSTSHYFCYFSSAVLYCQFDYSQLPMYVTASSSSILCSYHIVLLFRKYRSVDKCSSRAWQSDVASAPASARGQQRRRSVPADIALRAISRRVMSLILPRCLVQPTCRWPCRQCVEKLASRDKRMTASRTLRADNRAGKHLWGRAFTENV